MIRICLSFVIPSCSPDRWWWLIIVSQYFTSVDLQAVYLEIVQGRLKLLVFGRLLLRDFINMTLAGWDSLNAADCTLCSEMWMFFYNVYIQVLIWWLLQLMLVLKLRCWTTLTGFVVGVKVISTRIITISIVVYCHSILRARLKWNDLDLIRWLQIVIEVVLEVLLECTILIDCIGLLISLCVLSCGTHFYIVSLCLVIFLGSAGSYSTTTLLSFDRQVLLDHQ